MVMATGIVSIAAQLSGMPLVAAALFWLNVGLYVVLWLLYLSRLVLETGRFLADLKDHGRGVGFFTAVAGTCVLGQPVRADPRRRRVAWVLWLLGIALWLVLFYTIFTCLTVKPQKPALEEGLNGGWLLSVVATQSVATLGGLLAPSCTSLREEILFFSVVMWLGGGMLYIWIISLIFYRYTFFAHGPGAPDAPLLDQHGGDGDLHPGRGGARRECRRTRRCSATCSPS